jgi:hypothetical protein
MAKNKMREEQYGFRDNRSMVDLIFTVRQSERKYNNINRQNL